MAELRELIEQNEFKMKLPTVANLGNTLTHLEIEAVLTENGLTLPVQDVSFFILDAASHVYSVTYLGTNWHYIKLKNAI